MIRGLMRRRPAWLAGLVLLGQGAVAGAAVPALDADLRAVRGMDGGGVVDCFGKCIREMEPCYANYTPRDCNPVPNPHPMALDGSTICFGDDAGNRGQFESLLDDNTESACEDTENAQSSCIDIHWYGCEYYNYYRCVNWIVNHYAVVDGLKTLVSTESKCEPYNYLGTFFVGEYDQAIGTVCPE